MLGEGVGPLQDDKTFPHLRATDQNIVKTGYRHSAFGNRRTKPRSFEAELQNTGRLTRLRRDASIRSGGLRLPGIGYFG